jgi:hypothetical protein
VRRATYVPTIAFVTLAGAVGALDQPVRPRLTAKEVEAAVRAKGAGQVLIDLHAEPQEWSFVYRHIASGDRAWLRVGNLLAYGADAGWAREIDLAFGDALRKAPDLVLEMAPSVDEACGDIDYPFTRTLEKALAEVARREAAVRGVSDPRLGTRKRECLQSLSELRESLPRAFEK